MIYGLEEYDMTNNLEMADTLNQLDYNLIKENIREQIWNLDSSVDYLSPIEDKYKLIIDQYREVDTDVILTATDSMKELYEFILDEVSASFDIDLNYSDDINTMADITQSIYYFLILKSRKNLTKFYAKFIIKNKKILIENYNNEKRKDLSSTVLKKVTKNKDDIILLSKCPAIFKSLVFNMDFDTEDLLKIIVDTEYHGLNVKRMVSSDMLIGNIMAKYTEIIRDNSDLYDDIYCRVYNKMSNKLIKKLKD